MPKQIKAPPGHGNCAQEQATSESVLVCQNYKVTSTSEDHERLH